jgi:hypothetical protein
MERGGTNIFVIYSRRIGTAKGISEPGMGSRNRRRLQRIYKLLLNMKSEKIIKTREEVEKMTSSEICRLMERDRRYAIIRDDLGNIDKIIQR